MDLEVVVKENKSGNFTIQVKGRVDSSNYTEFEAKVQPAMEQNPRIWIPTLSPGFRNTI